MLSRFLPIFFFVVVVHEVVAVLQQDGHTGYIQQQQQRVPLLYEAYYPEQPRDLSAETRLQEIDKLRELTSQLLDQEERLKQLASEITPLEQHENVFAPRSQVLEYVFSRPVIPLNERVRQIVPPSKLINNEDVGIASLTVSDQQQQQQQQQQPKHKIRHHHGEWLLRRLASSEQPR